MIDILSNDTRQIKANAHKAPYYKRKIKCPANYYLPANVDVFLREPVSRLKYVSKKIVEHYNIKTMQIKRDRWGNKMLDWKKIYELERTGRAYQPVITASYAIERVWDPHSPVCIKCRGRCMEGKGTIRDRTIKRLSGG